LILINIAGVIICKLEYVCRLRLCKHDRVEREEAYIDLASSCGHGVNFNKTMKEEDMLNISPETVCYIIARARQFHVKEGVVLPDITDSPADDWALQMLADQQGDLNYQEVLMAIRDLEPDQQATLVALMWLGRGDYDIADWKTARLEAARNLTHRTGAYLMGHPLVADYLQEALVQHGLYCDD
jgi:hypothetical protein